MKAIEFYPNNQLIADLKLRKIYNLNNEDERNEVLEKYAEEVSLTKLKYNDRKHKLTSLLFYNARTDKINSSFKTAPRVKSISFALKKHIRVDNTDYAVMVKTSKNGYSSRFPIMVISLKSSYKRSNVFDQMKVILLNFNKDLLFKLLENPTIINQYFKRFSNKVYFKKNNQYLIDCDVISKNGYFMFLNISRTFCNYTTIREQIEKNLSIYFQKVNVDSRVPVNKWIEDISHVIHDSNKNSKLITQLQNLLQLRILENKITKHLLIARFAKYSEPTFNININKIIFVKIVNPSEIISDVCSVLVKKYIPTEDSIKITYYHSDSGIREIHILVRTTFEGSNLIKYTPDSGVRIVKDIKTYELNKSLLYNNRTNSYTNQVDVVTANERFYSSISTDTEKSKIEIYNEQIERFLNRNI